MPARMILTERTTFDCTRAPELIACLVAQYLLTDRRYDSDPVLAQSDKQGIEAGIPPVSHRKEPRDHGRALYKLGHLVENAFRTFK